MNRSDFYPKLVDLYAGEELSTELKEELELAGMSDPFLASDMHTLRVTVDQLRATPEPEFAAESFQRVLLMLYAGGMPPARLPESPQDEGFIQYYLPISG